MAMTPQSDHSPEKCPDCGRRYVDLNKHIQLKHARKATVKTTHLVDISQFRCSKCGGGRLMVTNNGKIICDNPECPTRGITEPESNRTAEGAAGKEPPIKDFRGWTWDANEREWVPPVTQPSPEPTAFEDAVKDAVCNCKQQRGLAVSDDYHMPWCVSMTKGLLAAHQEAIRQAVEVSKRDLLEAKIEVLEKLRDSIHAEEDKNEGDGHMAWIAINIVPWHISGLKSELANLTPGEDV